MPKETFINLTVEKQEKVMRAVIHEFLTHGYEGGNIGVIAKNAGIAKGSMYQYFENKKELFMYSVHWSSQFLLEKYSLIAPKFTKSTDFINVISMTLEQAWIQLKEEKAITLFLQEVLLGTFNPVAAESRDAMLKASEKLIIQLIKDGQNNGQFRRDIDEGMLAIFLTGASMRFKESFLQQVKDSGSELSNEFFEVYKNDIKTIYELILNGMGAK